MQRVQDAQHHAQAAVQKSAAAAAEARVHHAHAAERAREDYRRCEQQV
jgi:hypothetical protein